DAAERQLGQIAVPDNLAAISDHYIAKLSDDQRVVLSAAAVCGVEFHIDSIANALQRDAITITQTCDELAFAQIWLNHPRVGECATVTARACQVRHALFRQVLYERTAPAARTQLHRKIALALERERGA